MMPGMLCVRTDRGGVKQSVTRPLTRLSRGWGSEQQPLPTNEGDRQTRWTARSNLRGTFSWLAETGERWGVRRLYRRRIDPTNAAEANQL